MIGGEEIRKEHFRKLWEYSIPQSKIIITGRPNYFMDDKEMNTLLRLSQQRADSSKYCEIIRLVPFKREQIVAAMRSLKPDIQNEIISVYDKENSNGSFCDLVSRPSLLFLTGLIWEKEQLASKISNISSAEVIRAFLTYSYKRQDEKDSNAIMNSDERAYFMQGIAVSIVGRHGYTNQIGKKELEEIVGRLFLFFPDDITLQSGNANKKMLRNRLDKNHLLQAINNDIRSCGVIVKDFSTSDAFCFAHKSFLEVLIADITAESFIMKRGLSKQGVSYQKLMSISNTLKVNFNDEVFWSDDNIFRFVVELLTSKVCVEGQENSKERAYSIYKHLHFYSYPLVFLGWLIAIMGAGFTVKTIRTNIFIMILLLPIYVFVIAGVSLKALIIVIGVILFTIGYFILGHWYMYGKLFKRKSNHSRIMSKIWESRVQKFLNSRFFDGLANSANALTQMRDLKVVAFFQVCRNLKAEQALKRIWPSFVFEIVERLADRMNYNCKD